MTESEFYKLKVGDTVKIVNGNNCSCNEVGDIGTITEIREYDCRVSVKGRPSEHKDTQNLIYIDNLELVTPLSTIEESTEGQETQEQILSQVAMWEEVMEYMYQKARIKFYNWHDTFTADLHEMFTITRKTK